jgi:enamine deaminase RidA (YjgF/YER057c/UK114 family)
MQGRVLINPEGTESVYEFMQFSQAVKANNMIWVSGQVGIDKDFSIGKTGDVDDYVDLLARPF